MESINIGYTDGGNAHMLLLLLSLHTVLGLWNTDVWTWEDETIRVARTL